MRCRGALTDKYRVRRSALQMRWWHRHNVVDIPPIGCQFSRREILKTVKQRNRMSDCWGRRCGVGTHLFKDQIQIPIELQWRVGIIELTKHDSLWCYQGAEQLHNHIRIEVLVFGLQTRIIQIQKCKWIGRNRFNIPHRHRPIPAAWPCQIASASCFHSIAWTQCHFADRIPAFHPCSLPFDWSTAFSIAAAKC